MSSKQPVLDRIAHFLFGSVIERAIQAAVSVKIDDSPGWDSHSAGPTDRPWHEHLLDKEAGFAAWRNNFFARRIVTLTRSYVVGSGITLTSNDPDVEKFLRAFWEHPTNKMSTRLGNLCDELTRAGEYFPILFTKRTDGMSYIRFIPSSKIRVITTDPTDYERETEYEQVTTTGQPKLWIGQHHPNAFRRTRGGPGGHLEPLMLHYTINRPVGSTRGESDLAPILPWIKRYTAWLKDRVRLNRIRTRQGILVVTLKDETQVKAKRQQLRTSNPLEHGIYVKGSSEELELLSLNIDARGAEEDGKILRMAIATGSNVGLHYLGEGADVNYATAKEMGEPTARFYTERQEVFIEHLKNLVEIAYHRYAAALGRALPSDFDPQLAHSTEEIARADNQTLSEAAHTIVQALAEMKANGWVDDETAIRLAFKFAGETLTKDEITHILSSQTATNPTAD